MPWQESCAMEERIRFIAEYTSGLWTMTELCARFSISRKTGYEVLGRYREAGPAGLMPRSSAPHAHGRTTPEALSSAIIALRRERPSWGPRKIVARLAAIQPEVAWPAASTAGEILKRAGLVSGRRVRRRAPPRRGALTVAQHAGHVWAVDHKGWIRLLDGSRAEPLTVTDGFSRYLVSLSATGSTRQGGSPALVRGGVPGPWASRGDPLRQRRPVRLHGRERADRALGVVDQAGHPA